MKEILLNNFGSLITVFVTIVGFIITYFGTTKSFKDEIAKEKISQNIENIHKLPFEICELMNINKANEIDLKTYKELMSKVLAYGSKDAVSIAIHMQQLSYELNNRQPNDVDKLEVLVAYSLLFTQIKYDLSSEIVSPESWFKLKVNDYPKIRRQVVPIINRVVDELYLNKDFKVSDDL